MSNSADRNLIEVPRYVPVVGGTRRRYLVHVGDEMDASRNIETFEGNKHTIAFELRQKGTATAWNVSTATSISLEWEKDGVVQSAIACADGGEAAWVTGIVTATIDATDVTEDVGTYPYAITVVIGGETLTVVSGLIEVKERPV